MESYIITRTIQYTTTLSTLAMGNHLLFEIEDFKITNVTVLFFKKLFLMYPKRFRFSITVLSNELERSVNAYKRTFNFYVRKFFL